MHRMQTRRSGLQRRRRARSYVCGEGAFCKKSALSPSKTLTGKLASSSSPSERIQTDGHPTRHRGGPRFPAKRKTVWLKRRAFQLKYSRLRTHYAFLRGKKPLCFAVDACKAPLSPNRHGPAGRPLGRCLRQKGGSSPSNSPTFPKTRYSGKNNWKRNLPHYKNKYLFYSKL